MRSDITTSAPLQRCVEIMAGDHAGSESRRNVGHKVGRPAEDDFSAELRKQVRIGARDAAVKDVSDDDDAQSLEPSSCGW